MHQLGVNLKMHSVIKFQDSNCILDLFDSFALYNQDLQVLFEPGVCVCVFSLTAKESNVKIYKVGDRRLNEAITR